MDGTTRKLQKVGGGTYTVSVPKEWATDHDLDAGDAVRLFPDGDGSLVICPPETARAESRPPVRVDGDGETLAAGLRCAYAAGIERVEASASGGVDPALRRRIDGVVRDRTGMRIVEESDATITVETVLDDREVSLGRTLVQLRFVTLSVFRTAVDLALDERTAGADRIADRRRDASGLAALVTRQFGRSLSQPGVEADLDLRPVDAFDCYRTARALDRVAEYAVEIQAEGPLSLSPEARERFRSLADGVRLYVEEATTAVIEGDGSEDLAALGTAREELDGLFEDVEGHLDDAPAAQRIHWLLAASAARGDRIGTVAREASLRREAVAE